MVHIFYFWDIGELERMSKKTACMMLYFSFLKRVHKISLSGFILFFGGFHRNQYCKQFTIKMQTARSSLKAYMCYE